MASNYKRIGNYIRQVDVRNTDARLGEEDLYGLSVYKEFIPTHANLVGVKFNGYKIVAPGQFTYIPDTSRRGDKIAIGLNGFGKDIIVSSVYTVFEIYKPDELNAEYLMMLFRNPEYDRFARYNSWGSAREVFSWEDFCDSELYIPDIEEQHKIVRQYKTITDRIDLLRSIDEKLQDFAFIKYQELVEGIDKDTSLCEIADITMGTSPSGDTLNEKKDGIVFYQGKTDFDFRYPEIRCFTTDPKKKAKAFDILMSVRAPVGDVNIAKCDCAIGRGIAAIRSKAGHNSFLYYTMLELYFELNRFNDEGTVFGSINKDDLFNLQVAVPDESLIATFDEKVSKIDEQIKINEFEISQLNNVLNNIMKEILS